MSEDNLPSHTELVDTVTSIILASVPDRDLAHEINLIFCYLIGFYENVSRMDAFIKQNSSKPMKIFVGLPHYYSFNETIHITALLAQGASALATACFGGELGMQKDFYARLNEFIPGAVKVDMPKITGFIPDGFIKIGEDVLPVEMKLDEFKRSSLHQLLRYVSAYNSVGGIAVGTSLKVHLPDNIRFVKYYPKARS